MERRIRIKVGKIVVTAELHNTMTAQAIWEALPIKGEANRWGDEIYFSIPLGLEEENAQEVVEMGDLAYWPPGTALCIFFGPTPASKGDEIRPASPVNIFGRIKGNTSALKLVKPGAKVVIDRETWG